MEFIRTVLALVGRHRHKLLIFACAVVGFEALKLLNPYLFKRVVDALVTSGGSMEAAIVALVIGTVASMAMADAMVMFVDVIIDRYVLRFLYDIERDTSCLANDTAHALSMGYHEREQAGNLITRCSRGIDRLSELLFDTCAQGIPTLVQVAVTVGAMLLVDWEIAVVFVIFIPPFLLLSYREQQRVAGYRQTCYQGYEDAFGLMGESIWNMLTIQSFAGEPQRNRRHATVRDAIVVAGKARCIIGTRYNFVKSQVINTGRTAVLLLAASKVWAGSASVGDVVFLLTIANMAYTSLFNFGRLFTRIADAHEGITRFWEFVSAESHVHDAPDAQTPTLTGAVAFDHVSFAYPPQHGAPPKQVLRDISFRVRPGETVALAGPSGGGKSTITKLLFRHYDITDGGVLLDNVDVRQLRRAHFRAQLGYVPQEGQVLNGTVAENIRFGKEDATQEEIERAARMAGAHDFIAGLERGYNTVIGEQGVLLSGGQRQRLCIARAIVRWPKVLVFDEATSQLDVESERVIQESLERLRGTMTIVIIAHRLSTIQHADRILVIENGRIAEEGSHAALVAHDGLYRRLVALQQAA
ncbi:MAG: ABC transporter ATP-binding protein [bacterium]|nr:ABC transporter ATP-binding protein [bacterium]